jgi:membrane protein
MSPDMIDSIHRARRFLAHDLWYAEFEAGTFSGRAIRFLQFSVMIAEGFVRDHLMLRASALTYFTVLSLIPLLAVAISIVGAMGVGGGRLAEIVVNQIAAGSPEAQQRILELIKHADFKSLGTFGGVILFLTTVLGISNVEGALNGIWGVKVHRGWGRRFPDYLAVLIVAPILMGAALSLATTLKSQWLVLRLLENEIFATLYRLGLQHAPTLVLCIVFGYLFWFLPNTSVRIPSALLGGVVSGILVVIAQRIYLDFSIGMARANALFGGFAALPLLFVWIYFFWAIVLLGAEVAFAHQNLGLYRREVRGSKAGPAEREAIGLRIALEIARAFRDGAVPWTADALSDTLKVPVRTVRDVLSHLQAAGILSPTGAEDREGAYQPGRPMDSIGVIDVLSALRGDREPCDEGHDLNAVVEETLSRMRAGEAKAVEKRTLGDLLPDPE